MDGLPETYRRIICRQMPWLESLLLPELPAGIYESIRAGLRRLMIGMSPLLKKLANLVDLLRA